MTRPSAQRQRPGDQGAIATIVAILFMSSVMLALGALTVDVGNISAERRQLQNGADAAAMSAARDCFYGACPDAGDDADMDKLRDLANANAADAASGVARVDGGLALCGTPTVNGVATGLTACVEASNTSNLQECPKPNGLTFTPPYVRVYTQTLDATKTKTVLPYTFGAALVGAGSGANQQTCAAAAWGQAGSYEATVPLTFSYCEWERVTDGGTYYAPLPSGTSPFYGGTGQAAWPNALRRPLLSTLPTPLPANGQEVILYLQGHMPTGYDSGCWTGSSNEHEAPGSFGWVDSASCKANITSGGWVKTDAGGDTPSACRDVILPLWKTVIFMPVFDCTALGPQTGPVPDPLPTTDWCKVGNGSNTYYHVAGWARFYISGWHLAGTEKASPVNDAFPCSGGDRCVSGWFLEGLVSAPIVESDPDSNFGIGSIQVAG